jgi:hypothetical protein
MHRMHIIYSYIRTYINTHVHACATGIGGGGFIYSTKCVCGHGQSRLGIKLCSSLVWAVNYATSRSPSSPADPSRPFIPALKSLIVPQQSGRRTIRSLGPDVLQRLQHTRTELVAFGETRLSWCQKRPTIVSKKT